VELFDAHTHIDLKHFRHDRHEVIGRAKSKGLVGMITSSTGPGSFRRTLGIVKKYRGYIHHSAGSSVSQLTEEIAESIITLTRKYSDQVVAVGEVGLDYHWVKDSKSRKAQEPIFHMFIELATELDLPIVIHSRKAESEAADILERNFGGDVLMHCFDGSIEVAQRVLDNGWYITLPANFTRYRNRVQAAELLQLKHILLETDGPYLSPTNKRNEPANVTFGCKALAELLELSNEEVAKETTRNAIDFYRI
jgi:TatD DNase family protein